MLLLNAVFLWISGGLVFLTEKSEPCRGNDFSATCDFVFRNVCFEFVEDLKTWSQARSSCENQGGELLKMINSPVKKFLKNVTREGNITWWLGEGVQGESAIKNGDNSNNNCKYMKLNPLQLIITSDCNQSRGFLCIHNLQSSSKNSILSHRATRPRLKRGLDEMAASIANIQALLGAADNELHQMEVTPGEPTNDNRDKFIQYLLSGTRSLTSSFALQNIDIMNHIINCSNAILLLSEKKCDIQNNPNPTAMFEQVFQLFQTVAMLLGSTSTNTFIMKFQTGTIYQRSFNPTDLNNAVLGSEADGEFVKFPSYSALQDQLGLSNPVIAQLATFSQNPHPSNDSISGTVCSLFLSNGVSDIKLTNLSQMIEIFLSRPNAPPLLNNTVVLEKNSKALTSINVSDPNVTIFFSAEPSVNVSLVVALSYGSPPSSGYSRNTAILGPKGGYRWMITPKMLQQSPGVWYIDTRLYNSTWEPGLTLKITSFMSKCLFWDVEEEIWSTEGCMVGIKSIPERTQCLCNHLTLFGSSFFVMPNFVDVAQTAELFSTVSQNYVVVALLCAFFGLYLVTLLWACYADRRSRLKRKITLIEDNHPCALYNYLISVQTGHRKNAGTSSNVTVKLIGSEGESDTHILTDPDKPVFERGAVDMFLLATPYPLGEVKNLKLQHDNTGGHPSWYINKIVIQDLQTRHVWHFFCNCWLSADCDDGMTKKTFNVAKNNEIASFRNIFQTRTSTGFRDEHIWMSIVNPPSRSPFTRAQRVSCCMCLLLCTMAINIAFWNVPLDEQSPVIFSIGSLHITWQEFMVGVESGLLMFPINILIITIFRSIRPRVVKSKKDDFENTVRPPAITVPTILKDTEQLISLVSGSPRNKISEMHRLETTADLCLGLDRLHEFIQLMQGETESDHHWVYCSKFLLAGLSHLLLCLEKVDGINFQSPEDYQQAINITNLLVRKAEMVFSSHLACCPTPLRRTKKKKTGGCWLPWWFVFLGWFLLLSISGVSTYFTLLYGFQYGKDKSIKWVMSLGLSLFQSIFILQPLKVGTDGKTFVLSILHDVIF
ncbi:Polycystic kidney disease protein 1-like 2 PC1-like 2 protein Polycystin-1L2 Precursor [Channa argus]|uniref:Polycystic kidney disease protein 1-like 2 PC1-like 2 protein Polycystin-1L2 n=1 Tax=Channa argus TaxID=215402 RepID=A0A6G1P8K1_CHAAH|nr:Polycystic kidney disease protein 1-like 2 PC1-like 2 protein Polycystin-1L2 Precursor [Channa argus]